MTKIPPKTLAKILATIACIEPGEHGLFWDQDGTMPWKELYWALQEEPGLKHVRESHIREIHHLGLDLPFHLDGPIIRLDRTVLSRPLLHPVAETVPGRLHFAAKRVSYDVIKDRGLEARGRPFLRLTANADLALRIARRRDRDIFLLEVDTDRAMERGAVFLDAGGGLYLAPSVPRESLIMPLIRHEERRETAAQGVQAKKAARTAPGSGFQAGTFTVGTKHLPGGMVPPAPSSGAKRDGKNGKDAGWKRSSRKERHKREA